MAYGDADVVACLDEGVVACLYKNDRDNFDVDFSMHTPGNIFLRRPLVGYVFFTTVICRKFGALIPIFTSVISITTDYIS